MKDLTALIDRKYEEALETIAYLKQALYCFKDFDPQKPEDSGKKVRKMAFEYEDSFIDQVFVDPNSFTPGKTFLRNGCKDTCKDFGTTIETDSTEDE